MKRCSIPMVLFAMLLSLLLLNLSCTKYARVPESDYDEIDGGKERPTRITKTDGTTYVVRRFELTEDSLIIHEFERSPGYHDSDGELDPPPTLKVPRTEILTIEAIELNKRNAAFAAVAVTLVAVGLVVTGIVIASGMTVLD